ncbi:dehydrogenase [Gordonibacter sp. 28C]|uniref:molybdopterin-dependent oxidoreductase n=1 Tax=Gordonibacter sp. 28C TaxID=2078569 RepID=UPI000DF86A28|nr:molybdopterin-dependent oxidoreductase [Gordonibacter sp. 28C]RDB63716.1 dehydrogenase [Gordonibacter sp. 28C]
MEYNNEYNMDLYPKKLHWKEGDLTATRTTMWSGPGCHEGCQVIFYTDDDGKLVKVEGDPNSPFNQGRLCMRCLELPELVNHEERLRHPMKRAGERGEDKWERVSWDEAYDLIEQKVREFQEKDGPESIISMIGTGRNVSQVIAHNQYANFGGPDLTLCFLSGDSCMLPRTALCYVVMGNQWVADMSQFRPERYENDPEWQIPECVVIWGTNPVVCNSDAFLGHWIVEAMKRGSELVTIDPQLTWIASKSKYWLRLRPGTDAALALGMMNVIIGEDLVDHDFIDKWTYGYEALAERVKDYPVEKVAEICWVEPELIVEAARFYAGAHPSTIQWGLAVDMSKIGTPTAHAIACLAGITGNIDNPGGNILIDQACGLEFGYNSGIEYLKEGMVEKRLGNSKYNLKKYGFTASSQSDCILVACETGLDEKGDPRPVNMLWIQSANPITNMGQDAPRIYRAMKNVPFICVVDLFKTPFAVACADLLLPCAMSNERDCIRVWFDPVRSLTKCSSFYEAKEDEQIMIDLGHRLNPDAWPEWVKEPRDYMNWRLQVGNCGFTMEELEDQGGMIYNDFRYYKYEKGLLRPDGQPGFMTPTGRYEFYISLFDSWGVDALPYYEEPPTSPVATPELAEEYPLVLTTGKRSFEFFHSEWRQANTTSRELHPVPYFDIHPETAAKYGLHEGEWAWIENQMGKCRQVVRLNATLDPRVVSTEHGWWFPEQEAAEPSLFGVFDCNPNNLIPMCENGDSGYGAPIKCGMAKVYPCTPDNTKPEDMPTYQVTATNGYTHGPSHKSDEPSFYDYRAE